MGVWSALIPSSLHVEHLRHISVDFRFMLTDGLQVDSGFELIPGVFVLESRDGEDKPEVDCTVIITQIDSFLG